MATEKQIAANRKNAMWSTGPRTEAGKRRSRRNALRHGLTAETVIDVLEDAKAYRALQRRIFADYRPSSNFELELVARLVSLLWRLRRAVAVESGLISSEAKTPQEHVANAHPPTDKLDIFYELVPSLVPNYPRTDVNIAPAKCAHETGSETYNCTLAASFMNASRLDRNVFERLGRYETRLWRQAAQLILVLNAIHADSNHGKHVHLRRIGFHRGRSLWPPFPTNET